MEQESQIIAHYDQSGLVERILAALQAAGLDIDELDGDSLAPIDEFHLGRRELTEILLGDLAPSRGTQVLDIGSGIGGPARYCATRFGCRVVGLDLTPAYVALAADLTRRSGLDHLVSFECGSALAMPFTAASFDAAYQFHVGMNIRDKNALFAEAARVLKPKGRLLVYDVMRIGVGDLSYPMPWAAGPEASFVATPVEYRDALARAGLHLLGETDHRSRVSAQFAAMRAAIARDGLPVLGLHTLIGAAAKERMGNITAAVEAGLLAPIAILAEKDFE